MSAAAVTRSGDLTTTQASRLSKVRAGGHTTHKAVGSGPVIRTASHPGSPRRPSKRRLPMCRMAASSLEISQFSVSVNMSTFMADWMLE